MLDYLVLYNSQSGNTKGVAAAIFSALPEGSRDLVDINGGKPIPKAGHLFYRLLRAQRLLLYRGK